MLHTLSMCSRTTCLCALCIPLFTIRYVDVGSDHPDGSVVLSIYHADQGDSCCSSVACIRDRNGVCLYQEPTSNYLVSSAAARHGEVTRGFEKLD